MNRPAHERAKTATAGLRSFELFYAEARDPVYRAVLVTIRDRSRAEDAVQEAFTRAYRDWERLSTHPNATAWVVRVACNSHRSLWRRLRHEYPAVAPDVAAAAAQAPFDDQLARLVWSLPHRQREVVALRILLDQSTAQTASALGIAQGSVTAHLHRALSTLRRRLEETGTQER
ncbi:MAG: sigma-70 family RNA polymerase sigma factor [Chloroflexota bacterium]|nr:sigma-70 family RNA polymerase sigma factor [Chloroflexota bacterium]